MPKGRKARGPKPPTKLERSEKLRDRIRQLAEELVTVGFGSLLTPPGRVTLVEEPEPDPITTGFIAKAREPLGVYIQRVSVTENFSQRPPFDHVNDPIYRRLIRDFINGALMPEAKVAALSKIVPTRKAQSLEDAGDLQFSIIDGLQRLYCYCIAILLVLDRGDLVKKGYIPEDAWEYFREVVEKTGDSQASTESLLKRQMRYEVFYNIDLSGLLHYMVTFNTGQRRMSLPVQLEIMQRPFIDELEKSAKIPVFRDIERMPGTQAPKDKFAASDLTLAARAFITNNPQVSATDEAEQWLEDNSQASLDNFGDVNDVVVTLRRLGTELHLEIMKVYAAHPTHRYILSSSKLFLLGLTAACGYVRNRGNMKILDGALDKLLRELRRPEDDPLKLDEFQHAQSNIVSSRGKAIRRLVYDTFLRFFNGSTTQLEWEDTAKQIIGFAG
ncbi:MAG TPA: hypothetical protein VK797_15825 [Tepidisphaeraceae bacterium]|jgi:hypothetical protein|nr:hypothetical protein [Tepidisphaeraceae bacterium]